jgi:hypothetical protein
VSIPVLPSEAYPVLIVHPDAVLALAVLLEFFQLITRRNAQVAQLNRGVQDRQFLPCGTPNVGRNATALTRPPGQLCIRIPKAGNHKSIVSSYVTNIKR